MSTSPAREPSSTVSPPSVRRIASIPKAGRTAGNSDWGWIVASLDCTHNYVSSIPLFGVIVTLCFEDEPVAAILHDAYQEESVYGTRMGPVYLKGAELPPLVPRTPLGAATVGWTQGYAIWDDPTPAGSVIGSRIGSSD